MENNKTEDFIKNASQVGSFLSGMIGSIDGLIDDARNKLPEEERAAFDDKVKDMNINEAELKLQNALSQLSNLGSKL